jgi:tRNA nucleotidyltransferase/poly(A) polymerase
MKLRELLNLMDSVRQKIDASPCFICGGTPRDKYMGKLENLADLDICTGDKTVDYLSQEFYLALRKKYNVTRKTMEDGHSSIFIGSLKVDFSSNFVTTNVDKYLNQKGIDKPSNLQREMFSRDFTCNCLLLDMNLKNIYDPTGQGFVDIKARKIKTCLPASVTLTSNRNRVVRAIYLAAKLGFDVDNDIIEFVRKNPQSVKISTEKVMAEKLDEAFTRDADKAAHLITKMGLWNYIPISEKAYPYYLKATQGKAANVTK